MWKLWLNLAVAGLESASQILAAKDPDTIGSDDRAARFLRYAATAIRAILNDQEIPAAPAEFHQPA